MTKEYPLQYNPVFKIAALDFGNQVLQILGDVTQIQEIKNKIDVGTVHVCLSADGMECSGHLSSASLSRLPQEPCGCPI